MVAGLALGLSTLANATAVAVPTVSTVVNPPALNHHLSVQPQIGSGETEGFDAADVGIDARTGGDASDQIAPLIVALDLSGSMNDDDGNSMIKLSGAKRAVNEVIQGLAAQQPFGVWTYPAATDNCSPGQFAIAPGPVTDKVGAIAAVDGLTADGGTPTGPALEAIAASLKSRGSHSATLVLVSDGESNCGSNPCVVAKDLFAQGFEVTVHTVGFRVSAAGRDELNCVASVTGGRYVDVEDSDDLIDTVRELTRAKLRVSTSDVVVYEAAGSAQLTVTVTNTSTVSAADVRVMLDIEGDLLGVNRLLRVGNLGPAAIVKRSWLISLNDSSAVVSGSAATDRVFEMSAWANNADRVAVEASLKAAQLQSDHDSMRPYLASWLREPLEEGHPIVIMGDSYSSGEGTFSYVTPPAGVSKACHRSEYTYLVQQLEPGDIVNLACSGAVSQHFSGTGRDNTPSQLSQLEALEKAPSAVVMTIGGNDIGFAEIVEECVKSSCDTNARLVAVRLQIVDWLRTWLKPVYTDTWITLNTPERVAQRGGKTAPVIVLAYPQITHATKFGACGTVDGTAGLKGMFGPGEVAVANQLAARLNAAIKAAVADAVSEGFEVYFVSAAADVAQPNHTICDDPSYLNGIVDFGNAPESVHPNVAGYAAESGIIIAWSESQARLDTSRKTGDLRERQSGQARQQLWATKPKIALEKSSHATHRVSRGSPLVLVGAGFAPGSPVTAVVHSSPAVLGTVLADQQGEVTVEGTLPAALELGQHVVVMYGSDVSGNYFDQRARLTVLAHPPVWVQLGLPAAGLLTIVAGASLVVWWRRGRTQRTDR